MRKGIVNCLTLGVLAAALAPLSSGAVIAQETSFTNEDNFSNFAMGQSVTTPGGGPWQNIVFNLVNGTGSSQGAAGTPLASGTLFVLTQGLAGLVVPGALSNATPGFLASTPTVTSGTWVFD